MTFSSLNNSALLQSLYKPDATDNLVLTPAKLLAQASIQESLMRQLIQKQSKHQDLGHFSPSVIEEPNGPRKNLHSGHKEMPNANCEHTCTDDHYHLNCVTIPDLDGDKAEEHFCQGSLTAQEQKVRNDVHDTSIGKISDNDLDISDNNDEKDVNDHSFDELRNIKLDKVELHNFLVKKYKDSTLPDLTAEQPILAFHREDSYNQQLLDFMTDNYDYEINFVSDFLCSLDLRLQRAHRVVFSKLALASAKLLKELLELKKEDRLDITLETFTTTSPRRQKIRHEVQKRIAVNAENMKRKYTKRKRIEMHDFQIGESVSVKVPRVARSATNNRRLPCVVVGKSSGKQHNYKLVCEHGTLDRNFSASSLMPYPAHVKIDHKALDGAAAKSSSLSKQTLSCQCRKSCNTRNCSCRKEGMLCSSHCHRGRGCSNNNFSQLLKSESEKNDPDDPKKKTEKFKRNIVRPAKIEMTAPINGGREGTKTFANTCPIDGWLFLLRLIADAYP